MIEISVIVRNHWQSMGESAYYEIRKRVPAYPGAVLASEMVDLVKKR